MQSVAIATELDGTYFTSRQDHITVTGSQVTLQTNGVSRGFVVGSDHNSRMEYHTDTQVWILDRRASSRRVIIWFSQETSETMVWTATHHAMVTRLPPLPLHLSPQSTFQDETTEEPSAENSRGADGGWSLSCAFMYWLSVTDTKMQQCSSAASSKASTLEDELDEVRRAIKQHRQCLYAGRDSTVHVQAC